MNSCRLDVESITSTLTSVVYIMIIPFSLQNRTAICVRSVRVKYIVCLAAASNSRIELGVVGRRTNPLSYNRKLFHAFFVLAGRYVYNYTSCFPLRSIR